ncbi:O-antigen ligase family protein [Geobacillus thermoleovorans]|uniref:O-antigen ligase family protein n=1 Tax=Geobacillus thermoleovorans TaxID=33941 RepID=UPI003D1AC0CA
MTSLSKPKFKQLSVRYILLFMLFMFFFINLNFISNKSLVSGIILVFVTLMSVPSSIQGFKVIFKDINIFLLLFFYWCLFTSFWSEYPLETLLRVIIIFIPSFIIIILVSNEKQKIKLFIKLARVFVICFSILAGIGLLLRIFGNILYINGQRIEVITLGPISISQQLLGIPPFFRITSLTDNPNTLAMWMAFSLTLCVFLYYVGKLSFKLFFFNFILQLSALLLTISRAGIATAIISLLLIYLMTKRRKIIYIIFILLVSIILISIIMSNKNLLILSNYSQLRLSTDLNSRQDAWMPLVEYISNNPFLGTGFGVSFEAILQKKGLEIAAHNVYLIIFSETGLLGGSIFLLFWIYSIIISLFLYKNSRSFRLSKEEHFSVLVCFAFLVALLFHQFFEGKIMRLDFMHFIWIYLISHVSSLYRFKKVAIKDKENKTYSSHYRFKHQWSKDGSLQVIFKN